MAEESGELSHPLRDRWFVYYMPATKSGQSRDEATQELDYVATIEEAFATINTLPRVDLLPGDSSIVFSRNKIKPVFESFPGGMRFSIFTKTKSQTNDAITMVMAALLGESLSTVCEGESVADVLRITHKPHRLYEDAALVEVWAHKSPYDKAIEAYIKEVLSAVPGLQVSSREMA